MKEFDRIIRFVKDWTLLVCMALGAVGYYVLKCVPALEAWRHPAAEISSGLLPVLIFLMLFMTFIKIDVRSYRLTWWHVVLLLLQMGLSGVLAWYVSAHPQAGWRMSAEGAFCCVACPTATAAAVIVRKLGGRVQTITTYTLLSGFVSAVMIPLLLPVMEHNPQLEFHAMFLVILRRVSPPLIAPFVLAALIRWAHARLAQRLADFTRDAAFYLWGFTLTILMAQTLHSVYCSHATGFQVLLTACAGLLVCGVQFFLGHKVGLLFRDTVSCTQGLGQKNTMIAVWVCLSYLSPLAAVVPGSYILWQNVLNSWQLWQKRRAAQPGAAA